MNNLKIKCQNCGTVHDVTRTADIPENVVSMGCNWCPNCMEGQSTYYQEWHIFEGPRRPREKKLLDVRFTQLKFNLYDGTEKNTQAQT